MSKKSDRDQILENLKNITNTERSILGGIYNDFFGNDKKTSELTVTEEEALSHAQDALNEAQSLFGNLNPAPAAKDAEEKTPEGDDAKAAEGEEKKPETESANAEAQGEVKKEERDPEEELNELIGLKKIKHDVKELADFAKVQKMRKDQGLKSVPVSLHLVFTGNPGTGKTTVARILGRLYKNIGILSQGQLIEVDRSGLVAGYVGQTAIKVQEQIEKAKGGVLFIDEAYSLSQKDDAFGQEAIDTILKAMEDMRDDLVVIVAGYTDPMEKFINSNPGLKSRFNKYIEFPDYTVDELEAIFNLNLKKYDYTVEEEARKQIRALIVQRKLTKLENFANAREVRNLFEEIITNQARRVAKLENPTPEDMMKITMDDLVDADQDGTLDAAARADAEALACAKEENTEACADQSEEADSEDTDSEDTDSGEADSGDADSEDIDSEIFDAFAGLAGEDE